MIIIPYISKDEHKKFKELIEKENATQKAKEMDREIYLEQLTERVNGVLDLNKSYGPIEAYALTFSKFMFNDFKAHKSDTIFFSWSELKRYLTERCLDGDDLKKSFRENLRNRGIGIRINRTYNTAKVYKCEPRKKDQENS